MKQKRGSTILNKQDGDFYDDDADRGFFGLCSRADRHTQGRDYRHSENLGVNPGIRRTCDKWAKKGCRAVAPDLFWGIKPGIERDPD